MTSIAFSTDYSTGNINDLFDFISDQVLPIVDHTITLDNNLIDNLITKCLGDYVITYRVHNNDAHVAYLVEIKDNSDNIQSISVVDSSTYQILVPHTIIDNFKTSTWIVEQNYTIDYHVFLTKHEYLQNNLSDRFKEFYDDNILNNTNNKTVNTTGGNFTLSQYSNQQELLKHLAVDKLPNTPAYVNKVKEYLVDNPNFIQSSITNFTQDVFHVDSNKLRKALLKAYINRNNNSIRSLNLYHTIEFSYANMFGPSTINNKTVTVKYVSNGTSIG